MGATTPPGRNRTRDIWFDGLATAEGFPVITLRDFARIDPDQWEEHRGTIEAAFNFGPSPLAPPEETP